MPVSQRGLVMDGEPGREVARALVLSSRLVYSVGIGPDAEVSNVQHPLEPAAKRALERENVVVESTLAP